MVHHVHQVLDRQARVQGVEYAAHQRHAEVGLQVADVIPAKARDPVTTAHAKPGQPASKLVSAAADLGIAGPGDRPVRHAAHHLNAGEVTGRPVQQVRHRQRVIHHQAIHLDHLRQTLADAALLPHEPPKRGS